MNAAKILNFKTPSTQLAGAEEVCPVCEDGTLTDHQETNHFVRDGVFVQADCHFSVCSDCGSEQANGGQISLNKLNGDKAFQDAILNLQGEPNNYG
jgi:hypothetical protein